jgi:hypothetical protein
MLEAGGVQQNAADTRLFLKIICDAFPIADAGAKSRLERRQNKRRFGLRIQSGDEYVTYYALLCSCV